MTRAAAVALAVAVVVAGCSRKPPDATSSSARYTLGAPYQMGGVWYYPRERTEFTETGLATVTPDHTGQTADGEGFDPSALAGAHHTLQLPAIVRVTNLEDGRQVLVRLNDRGPVRNGRVIGLTRHAAELIGVQDGTKVQIELEPAMTAALSERTGGGPKLAVAVAPRAAVAAESLAPPPGVGQSQRGRTVPATAVEVAPTAEAARTSVPDRLPDQVTQVGTAPTTIVLRASEFERAAYAQQMAARLSGIGARVERSREGRSEHYRVVAGPFSSVAAADSALDQARRAGVIDARLVVE